MMTSPTRCVIALVLTCCALLQTAAAAETYRERYRPQLHYTVKKGWINDPCGLVYYDGEYHLFNDHNPFGNVIPGALGAKDRPPSRWSHAVSRDLVHWQQLPVAILPDKLGAIFSGSGVVDAANTAGFAKGADKTLVLIYTSAGRPFSQSISYSNDRGRTWTRYQDNPVVPNQGMMATERDPRVFWHEPTKRWVMVLYVKRGVARLFTSADLKHWTHASDLTGRNFHECPDMFELPVDGDKTKTKWIVYDAPMNYSVGTFDGKTFTPEAGPFRGDYGGNFYAAQTWTNTPGRCIQIAWMNGGKYPGMPFTQQMSFPCELRLVTGPDGPRLYRYPVSEIAALHVDKGLVVTDKRFNAGENPLAGVSGDLFDVEMAVRPGPSGEFGLRMHGQTVTWAAGKLSALGRTADVSPVDGVVRLRILLDRTSLEVFANKGQISMSTCFVPAEQNTALEFFAKGAEVHVETLTVHKLRSVWEGDVE
ncbi:MAG: glycoside hydrolase family 32 protein [Candidatus Nealsonbacteria bacterium]|nr:glycoside hydrolase family 32 protein [Candidatus Nealsonbacteria bacterium]